MPAKQLRAQPLGLTLDFTPPQSRLLAERYKRTLAVPIGADLVRLGALEHDPEKHALGLGPDGWIPVFRKDHAPPKIESAMTIQPRAIAL
jgi:hypothetical protein